MATLQSTAFFEAMRQHDPASLAVVHGDSSQSYSYGSLLQDVAIAKERLLKDTGKTADGIVEQRIAFMVENSYDYAGAHASRVTIGT